MTSFVLNSTSLTNQTLANNELGIVGTAGFIGVQTGAAIATAGQAFVMNMGGVAAVSGHALTHSGDGLRLTNSGSMMGYWDAIDARSIGGINLINSGSIQSQEDALDLRITILGGYSGIYLNNTGILQGQSDGAVIGVVEQMGIILNSGTIIGSSGYGLALDVSFSGANYNSVSIKNSGVISGGVGAVNSPFNQVDLVNSGTLMGNVYLSAKDDRYQGSLGEVLGTVYGGNGNDTLIGGVGDESFEGGSGNDLVQGGAGDDILVDYMGDDTSSGGLGDDSQTGGEGNDVLNGNAGDDSLVGELGADSLNGGQGDDLLKGGADDDLLHGSLGADALWGDDGNDSLEGGLGDDTLNGGLNFDTLLGGAGNDILIGGANRDKLTGGSGADVFIYTARSDSTNNSSADTIFDFVHGSDKIDLEAVATGTLVFQGNGAFVGGGTASLKFTVAGTTATTVLIDATGDGVADMKINLIGAHTLTATDFIL